MQGPGKKYDALAAVGCALALGAIALLSGCPAQEEAAPAGEVTPEGEQTGGAELGPPPKCEKVQLSGCSSWLKGPICEIAGKGRLTLWVRGPQDPSLVEISTDTEDLTGRYKDVDKGFRFDFNVAPRTRELKVTLKGASEPCWKVKIQPDSTPIQARKLLNLLRRGRVDPAAKGAETELARIPNPDDPERGIYEGIRARAIAESLEPEGAKELFEAAIRHNRAAGRISQLVYNARDYSKFLRKNGDNAKAREVLESVVPDAKGYDDGETILQYHRSLTDRAEGHYASAMRRAKEALEAALRSGPKHYDDFARQAILMAIVRAGHGAKACEQYAKLAEEFKGPTLCERKVRAFNSHVACKLARHDVGEAVDPGLVEAQKKIVDLWKTDCPDELSYGADGVFNLAMLHFMAGDEAAARASMLRAFKILGFFPWYMEVWDRYLKGRAAIADGKAADALKIFEALDADTKDAGLPGLRYRALVGLGDALAAMAVKAGAANVKDFLKRASGAYGEAEGLLDDHQLLIVLGAGRSSLLGNVAANVKSRADVRVKLGEIADASTAEASAKAMIERRKKSQEALSAKIDFGDELSKECQSYVALRVAHDERVEESWPTKPKKVAARKAELLASRKKVDAAFEPCFGSLANQ